MGIEISLGTVYRQKGLGKLWQEKVLIAGGITHRPIIYLMCGIEHFAGGMATAALFTCMMDWCRRECSATDYTIQASLVVISTGAASALSGFSAGLLGYKGHFITATFVAFMAVIAVVTLFPSKRTDHSISPIQEEISPCS